METMAPVTQATVSKNLQEIKVKPKKPKKQPPRILKRGPKPKLSDQEVLSSQNEPKIRLKLTYGSASIDLSLAT